MFFCVLNGSSIHAHAAAEVLNPSPNYGAVPIVCLRSSSKHFVKFIHAQKMVILHQQSHGCSRCTLLRLGLLLIVKEFRL